jgi:uncharacterized protein YhfF
MYLPAGPTRPDQRALDAFWTEARAARPGAIHAPRYGVRWIGLDAPTTRQIFDLIRCGDKRGTFTLPWIFERTGQPDPVRGDCLVLIDFDGSPTMLVELGDLYRIAFGDIGARDTAIDGGPVRDPAVWKPLHTQYWNGLLQPFGLQVTPDMPVWCEPFRLLYDRG